MLINVCMIKETYYKRDFLLNLFKCGNISKLWSGREDLNLRPPEPHSGALAKLHYAPTFYIILNSYYYGNNSNCLVRVNNLWVLFLTSKIREINSSYRVSDDK